MLSRKERLLKLFRGEKLDRIPVWLLFPYHKFGAYVDVYQEPSYQKVVKTRDQKVEIFNRRNFDSGFCLSVAPEIKHFRNSKRVDGRIKERHRVVCGELELAEEVEYVSENLSMKTEYLVEEITDFEKLLAMPYRPPRPQMEQFFQEREQLGNKGLMMASTGDPLGILHGLCSAEKFAIWSVTAPNKLLEFMDEMQRRYLDYYTYLLDQGIGPVYFIVGAEFAGPPLINPEQFKNFSARYLKDIVELIRSYNKFSILHYHGNLKQILAGIRHINPDGLHTVEAPPVGDCRLEEAREVLGNMILIGNMQYDDLKRRDAKTIEEMTRAIINEGRGGRFILSPTAGPYEKELSTRMQKNYIQFIQTGKNYGVI